MKKPSSMAIFLGLIPLFAGCFSVSAWDRVYPMVFGLPFNLFWLVSWAVLTPVCMWGAYRAEARSSKRSDIDGNKGRQ